MKMTEVLELREGLKAVAAKELPVKTAYVLSRQVEKVEQEGKRYEELRRKLFEKYGEQKGERIEIPSEKMEAFTKEMNELLLLETDLEIEPVLSLDDLEDIKVAATDLVRIKRLLKEDKDDKGSPVP